MRKVQKTTQTAKSITIVTFLILITFLLPHCGKDSNPVAKTPVDEGPTGFYTSGSKLMKDSCEWELRGTDKMSAWDLNYDDVASWGMDITRECVDMKMMSDELLLQIVAKARSKGFVVILTAFWWNSDAFPGGGTPIRIASCWGRFPRRTRVSTTFKNASERSPRYSKTKAMYGLGYGMNPMIGKKRPPPPPNNG